MQIIGFNISKINAERLSDINQGTVLNINIEFTDAEKQPAEFIKEGEILKLSFKFEITYSTKEGKKETQNAFIIFEGHLILSDTKEGLKEVLKNYKKKEFSSKIRAFLSNHILRKCSVKAYDLQDQLGLPTHVRIPTINPEVFEQKQ